MVKINRIIIILVNDSKTQNLITADFFLPNYDNCRLLIGGYGQSCILKSMITKTFNKNNINLDGISVFSNERRNCDCCNIY